MRITRRKLLISSGMAVAAGAVAVYESDRSAPGGGGGSSAQPPPLCTAVGHPGAFWNVSATANLDRGYADYVDHLEIELGRRFAGIRKNYFPEPGQPEISPEVTADYRSGRRWVYVNGKPDPVPGDGPYLRWSSVAAGAYDSQFRGLFAAVRDDSRWSPANPFHYSFHHEQNVVAENGGARAGTPEEFRAAFAHVRRLMDEAHAHVGAGGNMLMCWTPDWLQLVHDGDTAWAGYPYDATNCDPYDPLGGRPYDLLGCDVYRRSGVTLSAASMWQPVHDLAARRGVAFFGGEVGLATSGTPAANVVAYLQELEGLLAGWGAGDGPGQCLAICWTSRVAHGGDYRLDAQPPVLAEYRRLSETSLFGGCVPV